MTVLAKVLFVAATARCDTVSLLPSLLFNEMSCHNSRSVIESRQRGHGSLDSCASDSLLLGFRIVPWVFPVAVSFTTLYSHVCFQPKRIVAMFFLTHTFYLLRMVRFMEVIP